MAVVTSRENREYPWGMHICDNQQKKIKFGTSPVLRRGMPSAFHVTRISRDTLLVFVNENCCLCICFTELFSLYRLLVVSFAILVAVPFAFSRS